jgi:hypothetical protein
MALPNGFSTLDLVRITGSPPATVEAWADGSELPSGIAASRLRDLEEVLALLEGAGMSDPQVRVDWLRNPHPTFGRVAPIDVIARDAHYDVVALIDTLT